MLNAEKYKDELLKVIDENEQDFIAFDDRDNTIKNCTTMVCENCKFSSAKAKVLCTQTKFKWLLSEYKEPIKLSKLEYDILKYMSDNTAYLYIARDKSGFLGVYRSEPDRLNTSWCCYNSTGHLNVFTELFQFIKWEEEKPRVIRDILENCVVVDDESES